MFSVLIVLLSAQYCRSEQVLGEFLSYIEKISTKSDLAGPDCIYITMWENFHSGSFLFVTSDEGPPLHYGLSNALALTEVSTYAWENSRLVFTPVFTWCSNHQHPFDSGTRWCDPTFTLNWSADNGNCHQATSCGPAWPFQLCCRVSHQDWLAV